MHIAHNIGTTDKLAVDVEFRYGQPIAVNLDPFANVWVGQHIHCGKVFHITGLEYLHRRAGKPLCGNCGVLFM
jgi:hypothetical protein